MNMTLAIALTVAVNADSVLIVRNLSNDAALRVVIVAQAEELGKGTQSQPEAGQPSSDTKAAADELASLGAPF